MPITDLIRGLPFLNIPDGTEGGVVAEDRIELPTQGFSILCSTD
jgi:hypothetical protein